MKKFNILLLITCILAGSVWAGEVLVPASASCRTEILQPTTNRHDSSKLSIRSDASSAKSWIKFDISAIEPNSIRNAVLRLTLHENEGAFHFDVSAVNDNCLDNIGWLEREITWTNAPANDVASFTNPDFSKASLMGTIDLTDSYLAGSQHFIDVTSALQGDTDGIVQFILHNGNSLINCSTHDHAATTVPELAAQEYWPTLIITLPPAGADYPNPGIGEVVSNTLPTLSWTNPDPNDGVSAITCDVYLGTEPNQLTMESVTLAPGAWSVDMNTTNFPTKGSLAIDTTYYWLVDCHDPSRVPELIVGEMWSFYVGLYPGVDAGSDQTVWLDPNQVTVNLNGATSDDGAYTVLWTQVSNGAPAVTISPDNVDDTSITFTTRGDYQFKLTANDGVLTTSDTVRIVVGNNTCDASHIVTGSLYNEADANQDCVVDVQDLMTLIVGNWLNCTNLFGCL
jgi:hypothetical protein